MKNITKISIAAMVLFSFGSHAQTKPARQFGRQEFAPCGTTEYEQLLRQRQPKRATAAQFEEWLAPKVALQKSRRTMINAMNGNSVVTIPVVVHIIHDGDPVGQNENIATAQVLSQITVLNQDFRRLAGTPGFNTNPAGADAEIEFCLAQRDPQGIYTTGINRYNLGSNSMTFDEIEVIKTQTQWDPEKYLNIWVVRSILVEGGTLSGYAQFPTSSGLEGLDNMGLPTAAETDGVVMAHDCFGSNDIYPQGIYVNGLEKGRIAVHEIGHFLGLRHIWGDGFDCTATDFCDDTPAAIEPNSGCPVNMDSCPDNPGLDMIRNYMDYTSDSCKNIFTLDQKDRMMAVLANSPRRISLTTSDGCVPGIIPSGNGSLNLMSPGALCDLSFTPQAILVNEGNNPVTAAAISYQIDGEDPAVYNWTGTIAVGQQATISLPQMEAAPGNHTLTAVLLSVNGTADPTPVNNTDTQAFTIAPVYDTSEVRITLATDFFPEDNSWQLLDSDGDVVASAGNFNPFTQEIVTVDVTMGECYTFILEDSMGDGICCISGVGFYMLETSEGILIAGGGEFTDEAVEVFRIGGTMGADDFAGVQNIRLYPNPAENTLMIAVPEDMDADGYTLLNSLGQTVAEGMLVNGTQAIDVSAYAKGVYFVRIRSGETIHTLRFIKK